MEQLKILRFGLPVISILSPITKLNILVLPQGNKHADGSITDLHATMYAQGVPLLTINGFSDLKTYLEKVSFYANKSNY